MQPEKTTVRSRKPIDRPINFFIVALQPIPHGSPGAWLSFYFEYLYISFSIKRELKGIFKFFVQRNNI
jgi:hypothetical protein